MPERCFYSLKEANVVIEQWRKHFNTIRPHSSLIYRPQDDSPAELATIEDEIDDILGTKGAKASEGDESAVDAVTLNVAAHRLEGLIHDRRKILANGPAVIPRPGFHLPPTWTKRPQ